MEKSLHDPRLYQAQQRFPALCVALDTHDPPITPAQRRMHLELAEHIGEKAALDNFNSSRESVAADVENARRAYEWTVRRELLNSNRIYSLPQPKSNTREPVGIGMALCLFFLGGIATALLWEFLSH